MIKSYIWRLIAAVVLLLVLILFAATEVDFVYTGF